MAKFLVTRSSYFEPFSYDELIKPVAIAQQAHEATQEAYDKMSADTAMLENYISQNEDDKQARALYDNYKQKLQTLQDNLWANGINARTKRDLSAARTAYASDITRLAKAVENRQARSREYWEARHKNPDLVMGQDPGLSGLDNYLNNDRYGQDYFSYDSTKLRDAVATEWKTRAGEMLRGLTDPNGVVTNPRLAGILTRIYNQGLTNAEVDAAGRVVDNVIDMTPEQRQQFYSSNNIDPVTSMLSESLIRSYDATGVRSGNVSAEDRMRLLNQGKAGLSAGILGANVKDYNDPYFAQWMELDTARKKAALTADAQEQDGTALVDYDIDNHAGENYTKMAKKMNDLFGEETSQVGDRTVRNGAYVSSIIYSEPLRKRMYERLGFDIGRNPGSSNIGESSYLHGEVTSSKNGKTYDVRFNPGLKKDGFNGVIEISEKGRNDWKPERTLTQEYHDARKQYLDTYNQYKSRYKYIGTSGFPLVDPDRQHKLFEEEGMNFGQQSIMDYEDVVMSKPENMHNNEIYKYYITRNGTDSGDLTSRLSGYISNNIDVKTGKSESKILKQDIPGNYTGTSKGIHAVGNDGVLGKEALQPRDVFIMDKDGKKITNVREIYTTVDSIMDTKTKKDPNSFGSGYLIFNVVDKDGKTRKISINTDEFNSGLLDESFKKARGKLYAIEMSDLDAKEKKRQRTKAIGILNKDISDLLGFDLNTQTQGGTAKLPQD